MSTLRHVKTLYKAETELECTLRLYYSVETELDCTLLTHV